ncbi:unnamed protein product [Clonostachys rhizophaga]|uniref:Protein-tyrosine-phosphatase n=1 Tax=Clonostachys rhizophaga TaxID=160324 RepID=A0A9N9YH19_9HYPO|nr:unnamed protein product [Clonostachys rhizophaga]
MATIAIPRPIPPHRPVSGLDTPITPPHSLQSLDTSGTPQYHIPVPNKHLPVCPPGSGATPQNDTPPESPKDSDEGVQSSVLHPPTTFDRLDAGGATLYQISAADVARALDVASRQPLPDPDLMFPWLHGLHPQNHLQLSFFNARRRSSRRPPTCLRAITIVKADGDLNAARLKGALSPSEILRKGLEPEFIESDPSEGFSVRNFQIQSNKIAVVSDIIVYGEDLEVAEDVAWEFSLAQKKWRERNATFDLPEYHTFVCTSPFSEFEEKYRDIVVTDAEGRPTGKILDFVMQERQEMWNMTKASEISHNVFLGPSPEMHSLEEKEFDILIECGDSGKLNPEALQLVAESPSEIVTQMYHEFPSSGTVLAPSWSHTEADGILETCKWIYHLAHGTRPGMKSAPDTEGDSFMWGDEEGLAEEQFMRHEPRKILIHCADGYTESSLLGLAYFSYSTGLPIGEAWMKLHTEKGRNFFAYSADVALLRSIAPRLLHESPACAGKSLMEITNLVKNEPKWLGGLDGSFPSRVLDYLYLGNLAHANSPDLLKDLGIRQILSVGETAIWREEDVEEWGQDNICIVEGVQDNGIDPLTSEFARCLDFIERGKRSGKATLVHCRVGVSRSATICIAEVMREMNVPFAQAYCFVRARRLNVIIQPHLRFAYELLKWEESLQRHADATAPVKRVMEWGEVTREIALMNRPYAR